MFRKKTYNGIVGDFSKVISQCDSLVLQNQTKETLIDNRVADLEKSLADLTAVVQKAKSEAVIKKTELVDESTKAKALAAKITSLIEG